jgi:hypothetical protein
MRRLSFMWVALLLLPNIISHTQDTPSAAIEAALTTFSETPDLLFEYVILDQHPSEIEDGGVFYLGMENVETGKAVEGLLELAVVIRESGSWQVYLPETPGFNDAFSQLSEVVRAGIDREAFKPQADPDLVDSESLRSYGLPYPHADFGTITRSYLVHGKGTIDFDLTGRDVAATKDGTIVYANDTRQTNGPWWYWNTVIIQHDEYEYTLYGHLAPDSIPQEIKDLCSEDLSGPNCDIPVERGSIIGWEGNTGRSTNPHLHLEFGQAVNFVALPDLRDDDMDGDRTEPIWTPFIYREQEAAFIGYEPESVGAWPWGRIEQAGHFIPVPANTNVILNGTFDNGTRGWRAVGQINWNADAGVMQATRLATSEGPNFAAFYQFVNYSLYAGDSFEIRLNLGNSSGVNKTARVELLSAGGQQHGIFGCHFEVPAGASMASHIVRGTVNNTWANALLRVSVDPADGSPALLVDDVQLWRVAGELEQTVCNRSP